MATVSQCTCVISYPDLIIVCAGLMSISCFVQILILPVYIYIYTYIEVRQSPHLNELNRYQITTLGFRDCHIKCF